MANIIDPLVGDPATATWADSVADALNSRGDLTYRFQAVQSTANTNISSTVQVITGYTSWFGTDAAFNLSTGFWTCPSGAGGEYRVSGAITFGSATSWVRASIYKNSTEARCGEDNTAAGGFPQTIVVPPMRLTVIVGDTITLRGSGTATVTTGIGDGRASYILIEKVG